MNSFFKDRGAGLAVVVVIMFVISLAQGSISYTMAFGALQDLVPKERSLYAVILVVLRFSLIATLMMLWVLQRKPALFRLIVIANVLFTLALLAHTRALILVLLGSVSEAVNALMVDVVLMAVSNILIFSIWYWIIDPPGVEDVPRADEEWDFLFPQRGSSLPHFVLWAPRYADYLFLSFTTSLAFGPTDTPPLTRRAKMLMLLQATISVVTLTVIAGSAINILAG